MSGTFLLFFFLSKQQTLVRKTTPPADEMIPARIIRIRWKKLNVRDKLSLSYSPCLYRVHGPRRRGSTHLYTQNASRANIAGTPFFFLSFFVEPTTTLLSAFFFYYKGSPWYTSKTTCIQQRAHRTVLSVYVCCFCGPICIDHKYLHRRLIINNPVNGSTIPYNIRVRALVHLRPTDNINVYGLWYPDEIRSVGPPQPATSIGKAKNK